MTNRREEEFAYSGPSRSGVVWAAGLVLLALIIGVIVLQKVDSKKISVAGSTLSPTETTTSVADSSTPVVAGDPNVPTTIATAARLPAAVRVIVTNGSGVNKAARRVNEALVPSGYQMISPRDANAKNLADAVFFKPTFEAEANAIAASLGAPTVPIFVGPLPLTPTIKAPPAIPDFDIQVIVGPALATRYKPGGTPAAATDPAAASAPAPTPTPAP
jgi:LytR cell envelope-related transcriptional attenuator